jgi:hypothetical protein
MSERAECVMLNKGPYLDDAVTPRSTTSCGEWQSITIRTLVASATSWSAASAH